MKSGGGVVERLVRLLLTMLVGVVLSLSAQGVQVPVAADVFVDDTPAVSWRLNGRTYATRIVGNTAFVGGSFTAAISPTGQSVPRRNLAAFDMTTGALLTGWRADADSTVHALESDGTWLYVGGSFTTVDGQSRRRLAKVGTVTGDLDPGFAPNFNATVRALVLDGSSVFAGGHFTSVNGVTRLRVAKLSTGGQLDGQFSPNANANVFGITKAPSSSVVYVSGPFSQLNGVSRNGVGGLNALTGATAGPSFASSARPTLGLMVNADGSRLYGAGGTGLNAVSAWNSSTGVRIWTHRAMGDIQAVDYYDGTVYFGFHEGFQGNTRLRVLAADAVTGVLDPGFRPAFDRFWGVAAIDVAANGVVVGGDFTRVSGVPAQGWARFPGTGTPAPPPGDTETLLVPLDEDASILPEAPTTNFGDDATWLVDGSTVKQSLLKLVVAGVGSRPVLSARLRIHCVNPSNVGGSFYATGSAWNEGTVTWNTAPATIGSALDILGGVQTGGDYEVDLTGYVTGDGTFALRATSPSSDGADYASSESGTGPVLELVLGPAP